MLYRPKAKLSSLPCASHSSTRKGNDTTLRTSKNCRYSISKNEKNQEIIALDDSSEEDDNVENIKVTTFTKAAGNNKNHVENQVLLGGFDKHSLFSKQQQQEKKQKLKSVAHDKQPRLLSSSKYQQQQQEKKIMIKSVAQDIQPRLLSSSSSSSPPSSHLGDHINIATLSSINNGKINAAITATSGTVRAPNFYNANSKTDERVVNCIIPRKKKKSRAMKFVPLSFSKKRDIKSFSSTQATPSAASSSLSKTAALQSPPSSSNTIMKNKKKRKTPLLSTFIPMKNSTKKTATPSMSSSINVIGGATQQQNGPSRHSQIGQNDSSKSRPCTAAQIHLNHHNQQSSCFDSSSLNSNNKKQRSSTYNDDESNRHMAQKKQRLSHAPATTKANQRRSPISNKSSSTRTSIDPNTPSLNDSVKRKLPTKESSNPQKQQQQQELSNHDIDIECPRVFELTSPPPTVNSSSTRTSIDTNTPSLNDLAKRKLPAKESSNNQQKQQELPNHESDSQCSEVLETSSPPSTEIIQIPSYLVDEGDEDPFASGDENDEIFSANTTSNDKKSDLALEKSLVVTKPLVQEIDPNMSICWSCDTILNDDYQRNDDGGCSSYFQIHEHPLMKVSTCAPCSDVAYAVESDVQKLIHGDFGENEDVESLYFDPNTREMQVCSWCCNEEDNNILFLCDNCPRINCERCVTLAHGGSEKGQNVVNKLKVDGGPWSCLFCSPTPFIGKMRIWIGGSDSTVNEGNNLRSDEDDDDAAVHRLLQRLDMAEKMKEEAEQMLEYESEERIWNEIKNEFTTKNLDDETVELECQREFDTWKQQWMDQHTRCSAIIGNIMDCLEQRNIDLNLAYKLCGLNSASNYLSVDKMKEVEKIILERKKREKHVENESDDDENDDSEDEDNFENLSKNELRKIGIEEINTDEGVIEQLLRLRNKDPVKFKGIKKKFDKALPRENLILSKKKFKIHEEKIYTEEDDQSIEDERSRIENSSKRANGRNFTVVQIGTRKLKTTKRKQQRRDRSARFKSSSRGIDDAKTPAVNNATTSLAKKSHAEATPGEVKEAETFHKQYSCFGSEICTLGHVENPKSRKQLINVAKPLAKILKDHQKKGVQFMWEKISSGIIPESNVKGDKTIQGCVLAHNMGLGKSLQTITLLHTLLTNPILECEGNRVVRRVLLLVPVNVLANWQAEFDKWITSNKDIPDFRRYFFNKANSVDNKIHMVKNWHRKGGVLCSSFSTFARSFKNGGFLIEHLLSAGPDLIILDEAHLQLKSNGTEIRKALAKMQTPRRIALTGTPMQNNLLEYWRMTNWISPGCLCESEAEFDNMYNRAIMDSLTSDSSMEEQSNGEKLLKEIYTKLAPVVHRLDWTVLANDLQYMQQAVIHVRQSKLQLKLYRAYKKTGKTNFLERYSNLFPVNNHPACLLETLAKGNANVNEGDDAQMNNDLIMLDCSEEESSNQPNIANVNSNDYVEKQWWWNVYKKYPDMADIGNGQKMILLIQILVHADSIGDKVVVFSQCLKTLNFIESILQKSDWSMMLPEIKNIDSSRKWGGWRKNKEYLRIDGSTDAKKRGELVTQFNDKELKSTKLFLLSSKAGNTGINLVAANRVILFDSHWNPTTDEQAVFRCYRYGQEKPVYVYRFLTQGTMEEKVYSRSINKSSLAARAIDQKNPERNFSKAELANILDVENWVQCDKCDKWRMLPPHVDPEDLPDKWFCSQNIFDPARSVCNAEERDAKFYRKLFEEQMDGTETEIFQTGTTQKISSDKTSNDPSAEEIEKNEKTQRDNILSKLLLESSSTIEKYYFHDSMLKSSDVTLMN